MITLAICLGLALAALIYVRWYRHEAKKARQVAEERRVRQRYENVMNWPPNLEHKTPWKSRRVL